MYPVKDRPGQEGEAYLGKGTLGTTTRLREDALVSHSLWPGPLSWADHLVHSELGSSSVCYQARPPHYTKDLGPLGAPCLISRIFFQPSSPVAIRPQPGLSLASKHTPEGTTPPTKGCPSDTSSLRLSQNTTTGSPQSRIPSSNLHCRPVPLPDRHTTHGKRRHHHIRAHMPTAQVPTHSGQTLWLALSFLSLSGHFKALLERKGSRPGLEPCLLEKWTQS